MFIRQAQLGDNRWWKYGLSFLSIIFAIIMGQIPITAYSYVQKMALGIDDANFAQYLATSNYKALGISDTLFFFLLLITFVAVFFVILFVFPKIHKRGLFSFLTTRKRFDKKRFIIGFLTWFVLACVLTFLLFSSQKYIFNFQLQTFLPLLAVALALIPIQVFVEEFIYRGYILQGIHLVTKNIFVTLFITTIIFAFSHVLNPEFKEGFFKVMPAYLIFSFLLTYIAIVDNGLEVPIGIHTANNLFVALILSASGASVNTPSLFKTSMSDLVTLVPILFTLLSVISYAFLHRFFDWTGPKNSTHCTISSHHP